MLLKMISLSTSLLYIKRECRGSESCDKNIVFFSASSEMLKNEDGMKNLAKEGSWGGFFCLLWFCYCCCYFFSLIIQFGDKRSWIQNLVCIICI